MLSPCQEFIIEFSKKIKEVRRDINITQKQLAIIANVNIRTIQRYESGEITPTHVTLAEICTRLPEYTNYLISNNNLDLNRFLNIVTIDFLDTQSFVGVGIDIPCKQVIEAIQININKLEQYYNIRYKDSLKVVRVSGDSMKPTYNDKDLILVDTGDTNFKNGI